VISARKIHANRANARTSTGPRTAAGKARAARNARRHGLTLSVLADPVRAAELDDIAREIAGEGANPELQELASRIAAAQIDLVRAYGAPAKRCFHACSAMRTINLRLLSSSMMRWLRWWREN
jgi:hypothetical protein